MKFYWSELYLSWGLIPWKKYKYYVWSPYWFQGISDLRSELKHTIIAVSQSNDIQLESHENVGMWTKLSKDIGYILHILYTLHHEEHIKLSPSWINAFWFCLLN